jgi:integrase/recombinase XerD
MEGAMISLAPLLEAFFTDRLMGQRNASPHTLGAYRDTFRLLLAFIRQRLRTAASDVALQDIDVPLLTAFLGHLEKERGNTVRTRNARLAAIHSFFAYAATREPGAAGLIQSVLAIPHKRHGRRTISFLSRPEIDALLAAPDRNTYIGRRDHALLLVALQAGLRVSELTQLQTTDVQLGTGPHIRCTGKGRKERCTPLLPATVAVLREWIRVSRIHASDPLFPTRRGDHLSRDAVERLITKYAAIAARTQSTLRSKRLSPHVLRHTCAMQLLQAGVDTSVIALWLGHESVETTQVYLHADLSLKERAIAKTALPSTGARRYTPNDRLLAFLESL